MYVFEKCSNQYVLLKAMSDIEIQTVQYKFFEIIKAFYRFKQKYQGTSNFALAMFLWFCQCLDK